MPRALLFLLATGLGCATANAAPAAPEPAPPAPTAKAPEAPPPPAGTGMDAMFDPTAGEHGDVPAEAGEDAAPEGLDSRASGKPDHPRTLEEIKKSGYIRVLTRN